MQSNTYDSHITLEELNEAAQQWTDKCSSDSLKENQDSNTGRAKHALVGLTAFSKSLGFENHESTEEAMKDFLVNIRHLADKLDLDFQDLLERSQNTYEDEVMY